MPRFFDDLLRWLRTSTLSQTQTNLNMQIYQIFRTLLSLNQFNENIAAVFYIVFEKLLNDALDYCIAAKIPVKNSSKKQLCESPDFVAKVRVHIPSCVPFNVIEEAHPGLIKKVLENSEVQQIIEISWADVKSHEYSYLRMLQIVRKFVADLLIDKPIYNKKFPYHTTEFILESYIDKLAFEFASKLN